MSEVKVQTMMLAREVVIECPHCNQLQDGFMGNPAGGQFDCEDCNQPFKVHPDADIEHR